MMHINMRSYLKQAIITLFRFFMLFISAAVLLFGNFYSAQNVIALACVIITSAIIVVIYSSFSCIKTNIQKTE